jgi:hypothetical protein
MMASRHSIVALMLRSGGKAEADTSVGNDHEHVMIYANFQHYQPHFSLPR